MRRAPGDRGPSADDDGADGSLTSPELILAGIDVVHGRV
jgi:hypothetical protein